MILSFISGERTAFATTLLISFFTLIKLYNFKKIIFFFSISITSLFLIVTLDEVVNHRMIYSTIEDTKLLKEWKNPKSLKIYSDQHNSHFQSALMYKKGNFSEKFLEEVLNHLEKTCSLKKFCDEINCCSTHPHNIFLQILSEIGLIGLFFYLYFLLYLLYNSILFLLKKIENEKIHYFNIHFIQLFTFFNFRKYFLITFLSTNIFLLIAILIYFNNKKTENSMNE